MTAQLPINDNWVPSYPSTYTWNTGTGRVTKKVTTVREFNSYGKLVKEVITEEITPVGDYVQPYIYPTYPTVYSGGLSANHA